MNDERFLKETLRLAKRGRGWTNPNPMVGALIAKGDHIVAKGYHRRAGLPHAEIEALNAKLSLKRRGLSWLKGATLYTNLEPCVHQGRTPPCVDAIIQSDIRRVVCATLDPNPRVHGKGIAALRKAGIDVAVGVLEHEARALNEAFFTFHEKKRPFIAIKFAASLDGKIATRTGDSKWITNEKARTFARLLRGKYQAVLVGINTVLYDNPHLGVRMKGKRDPLRIILDSKLRIPLDSQVLRDTNVLIATTTRANKKKKQVLEEKGVVVLSFDANSVSLDKLLQELTQREIISVLVEGGGETLGRFIDKKLVDEVYAFYSPMLIGGREAVNAVGGKSVERLTQALRLKNVTFRRFDDNLLTTGYV